MTSDERKSIAFPVTRFLIFAAAPPARGAASQMSKRQIARKGCAFSLLGRHSRKKLITTWIDLIKLVADEQFSDAGKCFYRAAEQLLDAVGTFTGAAEQFLDAVGVSNRAAEVSNRAVESFTDAVESSNRVKELFNRSKKSLNRAENRLFRRKKCKLQK